MGVVFSDTSYVLERSEMEVKKRKFDTFLIATMNKGQSGAGGQKNLFCLWT